MIEGIPSLYATISQLFLPDALIDFTSCAMTNQAIASARELSNHADTNIANHAKDFPEQVHPWWPQYSRAEFRSSHQSDPGQG